ncbi:tyrosine-type recombinase/integrase [Paracandidimonas lactea]|uniref:tyrosine-type recombinase/integrase n=1 Tax=Paracandidimonas lactea TaxID=2895524 RepID=UPI001F201CCB|nr:tyrosine-type recombinase/integrase [Paracandidimonas lactea]
MNSRQRRLFRSCPTLAEALDRYLAEVSVKKKSAYQEQSIARAWRGTLLINRNLAKVSQIDLQRLRDEWLKDRKPATVNRRLALLSHLYTVARKDWGLHWLANPVQLVRRPAVADARDRRLFTQIRLYGVSTEECPRAEIDWILRYTRSEALPTIVTLAVETGMRRSEIVTLTREQIDLTHGVVTLHDTKNGDSRYVPLSPFARDALRKWLAGRPMRGPIFDITPGAVSKAFGRARERARRAYVKVCRLHGRRPVTAYFHDLRFHDLRHEATSRLAAVFAIQQLAKLTGHRDTRMTMRYYNPHGRDLARQLTQSKLGRWQAEQLRMVA